MNTEHIAPPLPELRKEKDFLVTNSGYIMQVMMKGGAATLFQQPYSPYVWLDIPSEAFLKGVGLGQFTKKVVAGLMDYELARLALSALRVKQSQEALVRPTLDGVHVSAEFRTVARVIKCREEVFEIPGVPQVEYSEPVRYIGEDGRYYP